MLTLYDLPDGVMIPQAYRRERVKMAAFIDGFRDAYEGFASVLTDIDKTYRRRESVLEAYRHGFRLGQQWHARRALGQETGD